MCKKLMREIANFRDNTKTCDQSRKEVVKHQILSIISKYVHTKKKR